jgi:hypothetical protein
VADPAVIKVLAQHYKVGDDCTTAKEACLHNEQIAQRAGLYCRAAVMIIAFARILFLTWFFEGLVCHLHSAAGLANIS